MNKPPVAVQRGAYRISTDPALLDIGVIHEWLSTQSYWAQGRSYEVVAQAIAHSLCFGVYRGSEQAGFARVVTDYATFGWLCDVFILDAHRGQGLGTWLVETVVAHPQLAEMRLLILATRDAHTLYARHGDFVPLEQADRWMLRRRG
jgi:GNAT superfamily N-acetyltransferase